MNKSVCEKRRKKREQQNDENKKSAAAKLKASRALYVEEFDFFAFHRLKCFTKLVEMDSSVLTNTFQVYK